MTHYWKWHQCCCFSIFQTLRYRPLAAGIGRLPPIMHINIYSYLVHESRRLLGTCLRESQQSMPGYKA